MKDRLVQLRKSLGLTQGEFGKMVNLTDPMISLYESGKRIPNDRVIQLICTTFNIREEWLREGKGEMIDDEALLSEKEKRLLALFEKLSQTAQEMLIAYAKKLRSDEQALRGEAPEAPQEGKPKKATKKRINPVHNKDMG
jgi:transcriptional regulator with XRE-family HTH domain